MFSLAVRHRVCFKGTHGASGAATIVSLKPSAVTSRLHVTRRIHVRHLRLRPRGLQETGRHLVFPSLSYTHTHTRAPALCLLIVSFCQFCVQLSCSLEKCSFTRCTDLLMSTFGNKRLSAESELSSVVICA